MISKNNAKSYCRDDISMIENYQQAISSKELWVCHHRLELTMDGGFAHDVKELKRLGMYFNRPYFELIFLSRSEHRRIHNHNGMSNATKKKLSEASSGTRNAMYGKHPSEETLEKMRRKRGECFKGNENWMKMHIGTNNVSKRDDVRSKISEKAKNRYKITRPDGSWYWGHR